MDIGKLIVFSAPSGSGKTTLVRHLLKQSLPLGFSISATSRRPRGKEKNGVDYHFLTPKNFEKKIKQGEFLEFEEVYQNLFYGTLFSELNRIWSEGHHILFDIDVKGGLNIKKKYPLNTLSIFVQPPSIEILKERLQNRATENNNKIKERIKKAQIEMNFASEFDFILINDDLKKAKKEVVQIVRNFLES